MSDLPDNPQQSLQRIRTDLDRLTHEYSAGHINATQYNALYRYYNEKRSLIERLLARNPDGDTWRAAAAESQTAYLRETLEARVLYYVVFRRGDKIPLIAEGKLVTRNAEQVHRMMQVLWAMESWRKGLARKSMGDGMWMLLCIGEYSLTLAVYFLQPSNTQTNLLKEMQEDFEKANRLSLQRNLPAERMVFPQRALIEK